MERGIIDQDIFSLMVFMVVATILITPNLLRWTFHDRPVSKKTAKKTEEDAVEAGTAL